MIRERERERLITEFQVKWLGHVLRMKEDRLPLGAYKKISKIILPFARKIK